MVGVFKTQWLVGILAFAFVGGGAVLHVYLQGHEVQAGAGDNVSGWAWSDNIGWISFNCTDEGTCGVVDYGVNVNVANGNFSGHAWAAGEDLGSAVGWIDFSPVGPYPEAPNYSACLDRASVVGENCDGAGNNTVSGWARALANGGGWDGWIKLRGDIDGDLIDDYGVLWNPVSKEFEGWAWGGEVIGWTSFNSTTGGGAPHAVRLDANTGPTAAMDCSAWSCLTWRRSTGFDPVPTFANTSTDPDGVGDIVLSEWDVVPGGTSPDLTCASNCPYAVPLSFTPGSYTMELRVEDSVGNSDSALPQPFTINQDIEADFDCSLDGINPTPCSSVMVVPGQTIYFLDTSVPSEGSAITSWAWDFENDGVVDDTVQNPSHVYLSTGTKTVELCVDDPQRPPHCITKDVNVSPPDPPGWREIFPF